MTDDLSADLDQLIFEARQRPIFDRLWSTVGPLTEHASLAKLMVDIATGAVQDAHEKGPMSALGRFGGLKGGRARADKLSSERRVEIAKQAAAARWRKNDG